MKIIVCPMDWGWGHATRVIPVINKCLKHGHNVIIGSSGTSGKLLKSEFPELEHIRLPSNNVRYSWRNSQVLAILLQLPVFLFSIIREHFYIKKLNRKHQFDVIISDNRYAVRTSKSYNIFITHQLNIIFPGPIKPLSGIIHFFHHRMINKFNEIWVPDDKSNLNVSGVLSDNPGFAEKLNETGLLSRFSSNSLSEEQDFHYDLLIILSGPEPQRSILEKKLLTQLNNTDMRVLLIRGSFVSLTSNPSTLEVCSYMDSKTLQQSMRTSKMVLCRSGYSSIMDLIRLKKQAILIPTPGQTEQEYLANRMKKRRLFYSVTQDNLKILQDIQSASRYQPPDEPFTQQLEDLIQKKINRD
jgi:UDP-N-acetylglucosamine transferase subunit ALG13